MQLFYLKKQYTILNREEKIACLVGFSLIVMVTYQIQFKNIIFKFYVKIFDDEIFQYYEELR